MNKWARLFLDGIGLLADVFLCGSFWHGGNHDAAWGWGVAAIWTFTSFCESVSEVL